MAYLPIESHGIIGDLHSAALVGKNGSIDWCCLPHFDSPSVFAEILDDEIGGAFALTPVGEYQSRQMYIPDTNVLVTRFSTPSGIAQIEDFMPVRSVEKLSALPQQIIRRVSCIRGECAFTLRCRPAFNYARAPFRPLFRDQGVIFETEGPYTYALSTRIHMTFRDQTAIGEFVVKETESESFVFFLFPTEQSGDPFATLIDTRDCLEQTARFWQRWISHCTYTGRWAGAVYRSALALKLLTFEPTGAIVAAPTLGLPETIGGERNWDYRYTWLRDASFTIYSLMRIGFAEEAAKFMTWLEARCEEMNVAARNPLNPLAWVGADSEQPLSAAVPPLNLMYGIQGDHVLSETTLSHLKGYMSSKPVRVGNAAHNQLQLDIYGEVVDAVYLFNKHAFPVSYSLWSNVRRIADWVSGNWSRADESIWEPRNGRKDFVYSRLMCWVALDRAVRMITEHSVPGNWTKWASERDRIYDEIMTRGWNVERKAFRQHYDTTALDAANLMMPITGFISGIDPRMSTTLDATLESLTRDSLVYRYDPDRSPDGLPDKEGTFCICTFWLVECLNRANRHEEAQYLFQKMLSYSNEVGLFSEELGPRGEMLGNFPQAFTHLGLISAACDLERPRRMSQQRTLISTPRSVP